MYNIYIHLFVQVQVCAGVLYASDLQSIKYRALLIIYRALLITYTGASMCWCSIRL